MIDYRQEYSHDIKLLEPAQQPQVDIQLIHTDEQNSSHLHGASKSASESQSFVQDRRRSDREVEKPSDNEDKDVIPEENGSRILVYNEGLNGFEDLDVINYVENVQVVNMIGEPEVGNREFKVEDQAGIDKDISPVNSEKAVSKLEIETQEEIKRLEELRKQREIEAQAHAARKNASLRQAELDALSSLTGEVGRANQIVSKYK